MENAENKAAIFAMGGMSIDRSIAWLNAPEGSDSIISGTYIAGNDKMKVPVHSKNRIFDTVAGVIVLFILSPFLIIISALVFASAIRSIVLNKEQVGLRRGKTMEFRFRSWVHHPKAEQSEYSELEKLLVVPGQKSPWHIIPDGIKWNLDKWKRTDLQFRDNSSHKNKAALFLKTFQTILLAKES